MVLVVALALVASTGVFLTALGVVALARPPLARRFLLGFASSAAKHYLELGVRVVAGTAFVLAAPSMVGSAAVSGAGWVLLLTTGVMLCIPWRAHRAFTLRTVPHALEYLPLFGLASAAAGATLLWDVFCARAA